MSGLTKAILRLVLIWGLFLVGCIVMYMLVGDMVVR